MAASPVLFERRPVVVVMGVSGSGKSTVGGLLSERLAVPFLDADDYHPKANLAKMSTGIALTDADRWPWLKITGKAIRQQATLSGGVVAACSALKRAYRTALSGHIGIPTIYVLLNGTRECLLRRLRARTDHYMPPSLLDSQLADLELPDKDEPVLSVSIEQHPEEIAEALTADLERLCRRAPGR